MHISVKELKLAGAAALERPPSSGVKNASGTHSRGISTISSYQTERVHGRSFGHFFFAPFKVGFISLWPLPPDIIPTAHAAAVVVCACT